MKVCVMGLGQVGLPTALFMKESGLEVQGYDISEAAVKRAEDARIEATDIWRDVRPAEVYVICVYAGLKDLSPDMSQVYDVCSKITEKKKPGLVSIESTLCPGTSRRVYNEIFDGGIRLVHVPHRYWAGDPVRHGVRQMRAIGAVDAESLDIGLKFYKERLEIPLHIVSSVEVAEMCKIAEQSYRYVQIAFAEELKMICDEVGLDFGDVREACNTKWNIEMLEARDGITGSCLPKDIRFLLSMTKLSSLLKGAVDADQAYQDWLSKRRDPAS